MSRVFCLGEALVDLFFDENDLSQVKPQVGGSVLNAALTLKNASCFYGRPLKIELISEWGDDVAGKFIEESLRKSGIGTHYSQVFREGSTALVQVQLKNGQPSYFFNKNYPKERFENFQFECNEAAICLFGSWASLDKTLTPTYNLVISQIKKAGGLVYYDPNLRPSYKEKLPKLQQKVWENTQKADWVKMSSEDLEILLNTDSQTEHLEYLNRLQKNVIYTQGSESILWKLSDGFWNEHTVIPVDVVSAVGAGDNFNAGFVFELIEHYFLEKNSLNRLNTTFFNSFVERGADFAARVCQSPLNYLQFD